MTPPGTPPCETCRIELKEENEEVAMIYMMVRRQFITAEQGQVVDISIPAIKTIMDLFGVQDQRECLTRVIKTFHHFRGQNES